MKEKKSCSTHVVVVAGDAPDLDNQRYARFCLPAAKLVANRADWLHADVELKRERARERDRTVCERITVALRARSE